MRVFISFSFTYYKSTSSNMDRNGDRKEETPKTTYIRCFMKAMCTVEDTGTIECDSEDSAAIEPDRNDTSKISEVDAAYGPIHICSESPMTTGSQPSEASVSLTDVGHFVAAGGMSKLKDAEKIKLLDTHWKPSPSDSLDSRH